MNLPPIASALLRNKAGAVLIALQIGLTLAIICNALFIIEQRVSRMHRPTGIAEEEIFVIADLLVGRDGDADVLAATRRDLELVRATPGVTDAFVSNTYPLRGGGWAEGFRTSLDPDTPHVPAALYLADDHAIAALGLTLIAGRNFTPDEVTPLAPRTVPGPASIIVSKAVADGLYPDGDAVGKTMYVSETAPVSTIIGVVDRLVMPWATADNSIDLENSALLPYHSQSDYRYLIVRSSAGERPAVMREVADRLLKADRLRVVRDRLTYDDIRSRAYRTDRGMALLMGLVCAALLIVTSAGIVGLANFWVGQRHRQIGIRRALGARRRDILRYFQVENLMISSFGVLLGIVGAVMLNLWLMRQVDMDRLSIAYLGVGALVVLALGQLAVLQPARRAARVPPIVATRSA